MTIGVGFRCSDGIVIGADTQITYSGSHKRAETKIFEYRDPVRTAIFTYAGTPDLMRKFFGSFVALVSNPANSSQASSCCGLMTITESVLASMASAFPPDAGDVLSMIGAFVIPNQEMLMIKTSNETVCGARDYECVGVGDSSLLRFLEDRICQTTGTAYVSEQAFRLCVYLILQAKTYIDGCGGNTEARVLWPNGHFDTSDGLTHDLEKEMADIEERLAIAASLSFDPRVEKGILESNWGIVIERLKNGHPNQAAQPNPQSTTADQLLPPPSPE